MKAGTAWIVGVVLAVLAGATGYVMGTRGQTAQAMASASEHSNVPAPLCR